MSGGAAPAAPAFRVDERTGRVTVPGSGGTPVLDRALERLRSAGIESAELALRRRTLDDVFRQSSPGLSGSVAARSQTERW